MSMPAPGEAVPADFAAPEPIKLRADQRSRDRPNREEKPLPRHNNLGLSRLNPEVLCADWRAESWEDCWVRCFSPVWRKPVGEDLAAAASASLKFFSLQVWGIFSCENFAVPRSQPITAARAIKTRPAMRPPARRSPRRPCLITSTTEPFG